MAAPLQGTVVTEYISGGSNDIILPVDPTVDNVVFGGFGPNNDEPTTDATYGGQPMTLEHFDVDEAWAFFSRVVDGTEGASPTFAPVTNGFPVTTAVSFLCEFDGDTFTFDSYQKRDPALTGLALPQDMDILGTGAADTLWLWMFTADGSGVTDISLPSGQSLVAQDAGSSGSDRERTELTYEAGPTGDQAATLSKTTAGNITADFGFRVGFEVSDSGAPAVPAVDSGNRILRLGLVKVEYSELPYQLHTRML